MPAKPDPKKILDDALQLEPKTHAFIAERAQIKNGIAG